jgi:hypothetical protein
VSKVLSVAASKLLPGLAVIKLLPNLAVSYLMLCLQGGALNHGLKRIFSLYRPSWHIEAYIRPEKNCFVWAGPLANHHSILTSFFIATAKRRRRKERHVLLI